MNLLQEAFIGFLSGLTTKTGNEIHWKDKFNRNITVEPINAENEQYTVRLYVDGKILQKADYMKNKMHGRCIVYLRDGRICYDMECTNGALVKIHKILDDIK